MATSSSKDAWDKVEVVGKLASGIMLVVIAAILQRGTDRIANSLKSGQLVQSLIADLATPEKNVKNTAHDDRSRTSAFEIMRPRDSSRAAVVLEDLAAARRSREDAATFVTNVLSDLNGVYDRVGRAKVVMPAHQSARWSARGVATLN